MNILGRFAVRAGLVVALLASAKTGRAAFDAFLKFESPSGGAPEVKGDSRDEQFPGTDGWIEIEAFDAGIFTTVALQSGGAGPTVGKVQFQPLTFQKPFGSESPALFAACASGSSYGQVQMALRASGIGDHATAPFYTAKLKTVYVSSVQWDGNVGADAPEAAVSLVFGAIQWTYTRTDFDGTAVSQIVHWDLLHDSGGFGPLPGDLPQIDCPSADVVAPTEPGRCDAHVSFEVSASSPTGIPTVVCSPPSGSIFPRGPAQVQCTATDDANFSTQCSFTVLVKDQESPVITAPDPIIVECHTPFTDAGVSAQDNCDGDVTRSLLRATNVDVNRVGVYTVAYTVADSAGNVSPVVTRSVQVVDTTPPIITSCPTPVIRNTDPGKCTAVVSFTAAAMDACAGALTPVCSPPSGAAFAAGLTTVTCTATDSAGLTASCSFSVTVVDAEPPSISGLAVDTDVLWPPNRTWRDVTVNYSATDNCAVTSTLSVSSSEPPSEAGPNAGPAFEVIDAYHVRLRAERNPGGPGRTYTITVTGTDPAGNVSSKSVTVTVPRDLAGSKPTK